ALFPARGRARPEPRLRPAGHQFQARHDVPRQGAFPTGPRRHSADRTVSDASDRDHGQSTRAVGGPCAGSSLAADGDRLVCADREHWSDRPEYRAPAPPLYGATFGGHSLTTYFATL